MIRTFLPPVLSGALLWAAFFPLNLGPLGFVGLVPWLALARAPVSRVRRYLAAYVGGFVFFALATNWVRVAHPMMYLSWAGLSLVLPLFWVFGLDLIRRLDRRGVPLALAVPVAWVALEYVRMNFPTGFPFLKPLGLYQMIGFGWYFLGYTQHSFLEFIQIADLGGVYAVSFLVAAVNGAVADWAFRSARVNGWLGCPVSADLKCCSRTVVATTLGVVLLATGSVLYGVVRLDHPTFPGGPRIAAIQGSVPQGEKMMKGEFLTRTYDRLYAEALFSNPKPDLVIWPETCFAYDWMEYKPSKMLPKQFAHYADETQRAFASLPGWFKLTDASLAALQKRQIPDSLLAKLTPVKGQLLTFLPYYEELHNRLTPEEFNRYKDAILDDSYQPVRTTLLLGLSSVEWENGKEWKYNSALVLSPEGRKIGRYDKMHLVPFGEYVPLKETFPWMQVFTPYKEDYSCRPGENWGRFPLTCADGRTFTFACLICYEDSDPYIARRYTASETVDFLVNISNDGWFDGTEEHEEHLAISRFRAIEARRALVRSVNMGVSAVIDSDGRVVALPGENWSTSKKMEGVVSAVVPIDSRDSWYGTVGDWVPASCWALLLMGLIVVRVRKPSESAAETPPTAERV